MRMNFAFDPVARMLLALLGIRASNSFVEVTDDQFRAHFGPWHLSTSVNNVAETCVSGPYWWLKAIGPRGSMVDRGATFGTNRRQGLCLRFRRPVGAILGPNRFLHPGLTVTVADPHGLASYLTNVAGIPQGACD